MLAAVDVDLDASAVDEHAQVKRTGCELGVAELGHPVAFVAVRHVLPVDDDAADLRVEHDCRVVAVACGMHMQSGAFGGGFMQIEAHLNLQCTPVIVEDRGGLVRAEVERVEAYGVLAQPLHFDGGGGDQVTVIAQRDLAGRVRLPHQPSSSIGMGATNRLIQPYMIWRPSVLNDCGA